MDFVDDSVMLHYQEDFVGSPKPFEEQYRNVLGDSETQKQENSFKPNNSHPTPTHVRGKSET